MNQLVIWRLPNDREEAWSELTTLLSEASCCAWLPGEAKARRILEPTRSSFGGPFEA
jgi:hypothetical protein